MPPESIGLRSIPPSARFNNQILSMVEVSVADGMKTPLNRFRLDGQVAIVTGGRNGIGRATAELLVEAGAAVALIDRDERAVEITKVVLLAAGAQVEAYIVDVTNEAAIEASFTSVDHQWGRFDIPVNDAGISIRHPTMELSLADWNGVTSRNGKNRTLRHQIQFCAFDMAIPIRPQN
jgi:NAD(P)-dependent dehydrogenase (short-subunit alcohol dehydrogenase family)